MRTRTVLGEPRFGYKPSPLWGPLGQAQALVAANFTLGEEQSVSDRLMREYISIIQALKRCGADPAIINLSGCPANEEWRSIRELVSDSVLMRNTIPDDVRSFPRDMAVVLGNLWLFNQRAFPPQDKRIGPVRLLASYLGEGGAVLNRKSTALLSRPLKAHLSSGESSLDPLRDAGIRVGFLPCALSGEIIDETHISKLQVDCHVDRSYGLIEDNNEQLHLIMLHNTSSLDEHGNMASPAATVYATEQVCEELEIAVHIISRTLQVPYSMGFYQHEDGTVVMTGGDEVMAEEIVGIVGEEKVIQTDVPILAYPVIARASLRCLVGELPADLVKPET